MNETICLIGFMGSGKTTIGEKLAEKLGVKWIDLDAYITQKEQQAIPELFAQKGEAYFRSLENKYLKKATSEKGIIISTGGGIVVSPENVEILKGQSTYFLEWSFETLYQRIAGDTTRPLATSYEEILARFKAREALYKKASTYQVSCEGKSIEMIANEILMHSGIISSKTYQTME